MDAAAVQVLLGQIYDVPVRHHVNDFLLTERASLPEAALAADEQLLVCGEGDTVYLSLFVDRQVLVRLATTEEPWQLSATNLADWLTLVEGVSHFHYLTYHASFDRPVSLLELELQAEVDKYVSCLAMLRQQQPQRFPREVLPQLFSARFSFDPELTVAARRRYAAATRGAANYCRHLERMLHGGGNWGGWFAALRRFYRWPAVRKLALIDAVN